MLVSRIKENAHGLSLPWMGSAGEGGVRAGGVGGDKPRAPFEVLAASTAVWHLCFSPALPPSCLPLSSLSLLPPSLYLSFQCLLPLLSFLLDPGLWHWVKGHRNQAREGWHSIDFLLKTFKQHMFVKNI
jgi:hypothetical protein